MRERGLVPLALKASKFMKNFASTMRYFSGQQEAVSMILCLAVAIWSQESCSSFRALREALVALTCWNVSPRSVLRRPNVSSAAVWVTLLASSIPSVVKYQRSTYSKFFILSVAYCAGKKGKLVELERSPTERVKRIPVTDGNR